MPHGISFGLTIVTLVRAMGVVMTCQKVDGAFEVF